MLTVCSGDLSAGRGIRDSAGYVSDCFKTIGCVITLTNGFTGYLLILIVVSFYTGTKSLGGDSLDYLTANLSFTAGCAFGV